jgi:hypothetical protein
MPHALNLPDATPGDSMDIQSHSNNTSNLPPGGSQGSSQHEPRSLALGSAARSTPSGPHGTMSGMHAPHAYLLSWAQNVWMMEAYHTIVSFPAKRVV